MKENKLEQKTNNTPEPDEKEHTLVELVYCYYAGVGYSEGSVIKMDDDKTYRCDTQTNKGVWLPTKLSGQNKKK